MKVGKKAVGHPCVHLVVRPHFLFTCALFRPVFSLSFFFSRRSVLNSCRFAVISHLHRHEFLAGFLVVQS